MRFFCILFLFCVASVKGQDKFYYTNGKTQTGILVSISEEFVFFRKSDTSLVVKIPKKELLMVENYQGVRHIFGQEDRRKDSVGLKSKLNFRQRAIGIQPLAIFFGRVNLNYEYITKDQTLGIVIPVILTFDPVGVLYSIPQDSANPVVPLKKIGIIGGVDLNYYAGKHPGAKFFIGPKIRYGRDIAFGDIEYFTVQTQVGYRFGRPGGRVFQHLAIGYGFVGLLDVPFARVAISRKYYGVGSFTYRISFRW